MNAIVTFVTDMDVISNFVMTWEWSSHSLNKDDVCPSVKYLFCSATHHRCKKEARNELPPQNLFFLPPLPRKKQTTREKHTIMR